LNFAPSEYSRIAHLFIELRGKGMSLSNADVEILGLWNGHKVPPSVLSELLVSIARECEEASVGFPLSLRAVHTRLQRGLRSGQLRFCQEKEMQNEG
jgi:hypothetical protein